MVKFIVKEALVYYTYKLFNKSIVTEKYILHVSIKKENQNLMLLICLRHFMDTLSTTNNVLN